MEVYASSELDMLQRRNANQKRTLEDVLVALGHSRSASVDDIATEVRKLRAECDLHKSAKFEAREQRNEARRAASRSERKLLEAGDSFLEGFKACANIYGSLPANQDNDTPMNVAIRWLIATIAEQGGK